MHKIIFQLKAGFFGLYTDLLLETAILTAFYGFLRGGEFTSVNYTFNPSHDLTIADVSIHPHYFSLLLNHSKTDRDKEGFSFLPLILLCPLSSMSRLLGSSCQRLGLPPASASSASPAVYLQTATPLTLCASVQQQLPLPLLQH